jgi:hypothetical protein
MFRTRTIAKDARAHKERRGFAILAVPCVPYKNYRKGTRSMQKNTQRMLASQPVIEYPEFLGFSYPFAGKLNVFNINSVMCPELANRC